MILMGVDLMKDPYMVLSAYHDAAGITKAFNLNLLHRINQEMDADFDPMQFDHFPTYNPLTGETKSFLISQKKQVVNLRSVGKEIHFSPYEAIQMEISQKYDLPRLEKMAQASGFEVVEHLHDCKHYFVDTVWKKK